MTPLDTSFGTPAPSGDVAQAPGKKLRLPRPRGLTGTKAAGSTEVAAPFAPTLPEVPPPSAEAPVASSAAAPKSSSGSAAPLTPPKAPSGGSRKPPEPEGPPPKKRSLADPVVDLSAADQSKTIPRYIPTEDRTEVRFVLDYNGTSNVDRPGGKQFDRFHNDVIQAIVECLKNSPKHRVGIKSYIGEFGSKSQQRRESLRTQVIFLNRYLLTQQIPENQLVGLSITTSRDKVDLTGAVCNTHLDDKWETVDRVSNNGVDTFLYFKRPYTGYKVVSSVQEYLTQAQNRAVPKIFSRPFFKVPEREEAREQQR